MNYTAEQEKHHQKRSFQEEYVEFLRKTESRMTRNAFGIESRFLRPFGAGPYSHRLAPWALFFRRFAAVMQILAWQGNWQTWNEAQPGESYWNRLV